jgi:hypothetical protein
MGALLAYGLFYYESVRNYFKKLPRKSIVLPYIKKKWRKKKMVPNIDNLGLITGFKQSWKALNPRLDNLSEIYSLDDIQRASREMHPHMSEVERDMLFQIASLSLTLKDDEIVGANRL